VNEYESDVQSCGKGTKQIAFDISAEKDKNNEGKSKKKNYP
jgi:hypothetical protein